MVVQDALTGYVHEVPDIGYAEATDAYGQVAYDGYGNPVGLLPGLLKMFRGRRRRSAPMAPAPMPAAAMSPEAMSPGAEMPPPDLPPPEPGTGEVGYDGFGNPVGFINVLPPMLRFTPPHLRLTPPRVTWSPILRRFVRWVFNPTQRRWVQLPAAAPGASPGATPYRRPWPLGWMRPSLPYTGLGPNRMYMRCAVWPGPKGLVPALAMQAAAAGAAGGRRRRRRRRR